MAGCEEGPEAPPYHPLASFIRLSARVPSAAVGGESQAWEAADSAWIRVAVPGDTPAIEEVLPFEASGSVAVDSVEVPVSLETTFLLETELRRGRDALFRGSTDVTLVPGQHAEAEVVLDPVAAGVVLSQPGGPPLRSIGETVELEGAVVFATGDTAETLAVEWTSLDPDVAAVVTPDGMPPLASAVGDGDARIQGAYGAFSDLVTVTVELQVVAVEVEPAFSSIGVGGVVQLTAAAMDALDNPLPDRPASWGSDDPTVASVDGDGLVRGLQPGSAVVTATVEGLEGTATVEVVPAAPEVATDQATGVGVTVAHVAGVVTPNGSETTAWFEWATNEALEGLSHTALVPVGSGASAVEVGAELTGLSPDTEYWFRTVAENEVGTTLGETRSFTTEELPPPTVSTGSATAIGTTIATLQGGVNPNGGPTKAWFEWATNPSLDGFISTDSVAVGSGSTVAAVAAELTGLSPGTRYWFRAGAMNEAGTTRGEIRTFDTQEPFPPTVLTLAASAVGSRSATLRGSVNPNGLPTSAWFEWGTEPALASFESTDHVAVGSGISALDVNAGLTGLTLGTRYYFRVVATNEIGISRGEIRNFDTQALPPPSVLTRAATGIQATAATLHALVDPNGSATLAWFEWATTPSLDGYSSTNLASVGSGSSDVAVDADLAGLQPETTYYYRVAATNTGGTSRGSTLSFRTALPAPSNLSATRRFDTWMYLGWQNHSELATSVRIERAAPYTSPFHLIGTTAGATTYFWDPPPLPVGVVSYRVRACDPLGCSEPSNLAAIYIPPPEIQGTVRACEDSRCFAVAGVDVYLSGPLTGSTTTDSSGYYRFPNLRDGTYTVRVKDESCYRDGYPDKTAVYFDPNDQQIAVRGGGDIGTLTFVGTAPGFCPPRVIGSGGFGGRPRP